MPCFDRKDLPLRFSDGQSQSVALSRARHRVPEFRYVLVGIAQRCALFRQARKCRSNNLVLWIQTAIHAKENIGIDQAPSSRHLVVILIDPFAGDGFRQWWDLVGKLSQRVQPRTYLDRRARVFRWWLRRCSLSEDVLDVCFHPDLVRDFDRDLHTINVA